MTRFNKINALNGLLRFSATGLILLVFVSLCTSPAYSIDKPYTTSADYVMFDIDQKVIYTEGHAELLHGLLRIQAEKLRVDVKSHVLIAEGKVTIETMVSRNLRESPEESEEAGKSSTETEDTSGVDESHDKAIQEIENLEDNVRKSNIQTYEGNVLVYDLERKNGVIIKTDTEVRKTYLQGETLDVASVMPQISDTSYLQEEPSIMANAWTANRIRVSDEGRYEAWGAVMWVKGNKVLNVPMPYYTNSGKGITPGNLRLKRVSYSSNSDWNIGAEYEYSEKKGREGTMSLKYSADGNQWYTASVNQQFKLGRRLGGSLGLGNILSGSRSYSLFMSRYGSSNAMESFRAGYDKGGKQSYSLNSTRKIFGISMNTLLTSRSSSDEYGNSSVRALVRSSGRTKYFDKKRKFSYKVNTSMEWENTSFVDSDASMFVGVSIFRSAIRLTSRSTMNTSMNLGYGRDTGGFNRDSYSTSIRINRKVGTNKNIGMSYKVGQSRSNGDPSASQYLSFSYSYTKMQLMSFRFSTSYNLRTDQIGTFSTRLNYDFNQKCSMWSDLVYDVDESRFNIKNYSMRYNFYGSDLNARWYVESNDFVMDVATRF